ncbi:MAG: hypothetical protein EHM70_08750 [Chloroflexota bacterium]|nr:MAG: hypothetical protein EHM70_08750 [Chloroflexota bacterium]
MSSKQKVASKRQEIKEKRRKQQQRQRTAVFSVIAGLVLLVVAIIVVPMIREALTPVGEIVEITPNPRPMAEFNTMGDPDAPVTIIEYSDFQCPFCKRFADETEQQIVDTYVATGKVYFKYVSMGNWVSRNIAQASGRPEKFESRNSAEAAYCAGDQNKFWEYHDMLYANWQGEDVGSFSDKRLAAFAESLDLDMDAFNECYNSHKYRDLVMEGYNEGLKTDMTGTPAFIINGTLIDGAQPFTEFQAVIEAALAASE